MLSINFELFTNDFKNEQKITNLKRTVLLNNQETHKHPEKHRANYSLSQYSLKFHSICQLRRVTLSLLTKPLPINIFTSHSSFFVYFHRRETYRTFNFCSLLL